MEEFKIGEIVWAERKCRYSRNEIVKWPARITDPQQGKNSRNLCGNREASSFVMFFMADAHVNAAWVPTKDIIPFDQIIQEQRSVADKNGRKCAELRKCIQNASEAHAEFISSLKACQRASQADVAAHENIDTPSRNTGECQVAEELETWVERCFTASPNTKTSKAGVLLFFRKYAEENHLPYHSKSAATSIGMLFKHRFNASGRTAIGVSTGIYRSGVGLTEFGKTEFQRLTLAPLETILPKVRKYTNRTSRSKLAVEQSGQVQAKPSGSRALSGESQGLDGSDSDDSDDAQVKRKNESAVFDAIWAAARGGSESIKTRKARIYSVSGNKKYGTTKRTPLRPPAHPEPSSRDNSDECAASLHSNSNSADDAPKPIKTKGLKRNMSRLPQKASAASKAKRSRHHSETNVRKSVVTAQESLDEPMHSRPVFRVDTSDVVRDAAESDTNKFGDNGVNGDNCQNSDSSAQAEERKEPVIFDVKWDAKRARCPLPNCSVPKYLSMSMYTMHQHFRKEHLKQYPKYQLRLHCSLCSESGFNGGQIPELRRHMELKHGWNGWNSAV